MLKFVETKDEMALVKAIDGGIEISKFTADDDKEFLRLLGEWKLVIGDSRKTGPGDLIMIKQWLTDLYPKITLPQIKLAVKLSQTGKLTVSGQMFNNQTFSTSYCANIINSFLEYERDQLQPVLQRKDREPPEPKPYDVNEDIEITKKLFEDEYNKFAQHGTIEDPMNLCFTFLFRNRGIKISEKEISDALVYGKTMAEKFKKSDDGSIVVALEKHRQNKLKRRTEEKGKDTVITSEEINFKSVENRFARNYCVQQYFRKLTNIEELTSTFTLEQFGQK